MKIALLTLAAALLLPGCAGTGDSPQSPSDPLVSEGAQENLPIANARCPACGGGINREKTVRHGDHRVAFCNDPACLDAWARFTEEEKERKLILSQ